MYILQRFVTVQFTNYIFHIHRKRWSSVLIWPLCYVYENWKERNAEASAYRNIWTPRKQGKQVILESKEIDTFNVYGSHVQKNLEVHNALGIWLGKTWCEIISRLWWFYSEDRERDGSIVLRRILGTVTVRMRAKKESVEDCVPHLVKLLILEFKSSVYVIRFKWRYFLWMKIQGVPKKCIHILRDTWTVWSTLLKQ
jgi:hypothetical protein